jgi:hypothetical protein
MTTDHRVPPTDALHTRDRCAPANDDAIVLLLYGDEYVNLALADELELDGYEVRRASDTEKLRAMCGACKVELVIFGRATGRGAGLDVLRKRLHEHAPALHDAAAAALTPRAARGSKSDRRCAYKGRWGTRRSREGSA